MAPTQQPKQSWSEAFQICLRERSQQDSVGQWWHTLGLACFFNPWIRWLIFRGVIEISEFTTLYKQVETPGERFWLLLRRGNMQFFLTCLELTFIFFEPCTLDSDWCHGNRFPWTSSVIKAMSYFTSFTCSCLTSQEESVWKSNMTTCRRRWILYIYSYYFLHEWRVRALTRAHHDMNDILDDILSQEILRYMILLLVLFQDRCMPLIH